MMTLHRPGPVGVDISGRHVRAVQLDRVGAMSRVCALSVYPRLSRGTEPVENEAARLAGVLRRQGFSGSGIVLGLPDDRLLHSVLELPARSTGAPVEQIAGVELGRVFKQDPTKLEMALWELPTARRGGGGVQYMANACDHEGAGALIDAFEAAGLTVLAIEPRGVATARACAAWFAPQGESTYIVDPGWNDTLLTAVSDGVIVYQRRLDGGEFRVLHAALLPETGGDERLADQAMEPAGGTSESSSAGTPTGTGLKVGSIVDRHVRGLVDQLRVSTEYVSRLVPSTGPGRVLIVGEYGGAAEIGQQVEQVLGVQARCLSCADLAELPNGRYTPTALSAGVPALGLALHFAGGKA